MNICPVPLILKIKLEFCNHKIETYPFTMKINFVKLWPISLISVARNMYTEKWGVLYVLCV